MCGVECYPISKDFQVKADNNNTGIHVMHAVNLTHVTTYSLRPDHILELVITFAVPKTAAGEQEVGERLRLPFRCFVYGVHDLAGQEE